VPYRHRAGGRNGRAGAVMRAYVLVLVLTALLALGVVMVIVECAASLIGWLM